MTERIAPAVIIFKYSDYNDVCRFDKKSLRSVITAHGGTVLSSLPADTPTLDTCLVGVSDRACLTLTYLTCLAHR